MDIDNIKDRMERVYLSIGQRFDENIEKHINIKRKKDGKPLLTISFEEKDNKAEVYNIIFVIIAHIAKLKDHLKYLYVLKEGDPQVIENEVDSSDYLKLVIDLDNKEKHHNLKRSRSDKFPYLDEIGRALTVKQGNEKGSFTINVNLSTGEYVAESDGTVITITAEVKDDKGMKICSLDDLINKSIEKWEEVIKKYNLIQN